MSKILCVDFDGVIHSYNSGWKGIGIISDPPVPGAMQWLVDMHMNPDYEVHIYSARSAEKAGIGAMKLYIEICLQEAGFTNPGFVSKGLIFATEKPKAYLTIDDRAICFRGTFPSVLEMDNYKPWNK